MRVLINRVIVCLILSFFLALHASANDSDVVNCNRKWKIAILGSSTAFGTGATVYDSSWAGKFTAYVLRKNNQNEIYNLGIPGYTTYQNLCPTGFTPPANRPAPNSSFNITAAIALHPDAIIINMPSNDAANDYTLAEQQANFERTMRLADSANIPVWVTTTQPRNNMSAVQIASLTAMRDWIYTRFADKAVDFWTGVANADGSINNFYDYDYVHVNNRGHELFYNRIQAETILDSLCARVTQTLYAKAGNDLQVNLPVSSISLNGSASYSSLGGTVTGYQWQKVSGPASGLIENPASAVTNVSGLSEGRYAFLLTVTDNAANVKSDTVNVIISSRILVDFGPDASVSPDVNGNYWNNVSDAQPGIKLVSAITTGNISSSIGLQVINRIDGSFNVSGPGTNTGNTIGAVNDYPATATNDFAFAEQSATNGQWKITGLETTKQYTIKFWGTRSVADDRIIQIKRADQSAWQEYNAAGNSNYNNAAIFTFSGKTEMSFDIRVKSGNTFGYISLVDITRTTPAVVRNVAPYARANDVTIPLPATTGVLDGSASGDDDGSIALYQWSQTSGPSVAGFVTPNNAVTTVNNLAEGIYTFRLTVTDDSSAVAFTDITVTVNTRILIDFGPNITAGADAGGKFWNNVTDGLAGIKLQHAVNSGNAASSLNFEILKRLDGSFNTTGPGTNTGSISTTVGDYPVSAVADYVFAHNSETNGQWKFTGLDSSKQYTLKFWGTRDAADERVIQIKPADVTVWQEYDARNNTDYNNAAVFTFTGKTERTFDIRVKDNNTFGHISLVDIKITNPPVDCDPSVVITADQSAAVCPGTPISFSAIATHAGATPAFSWKKNGIAIPGANLNTYTATDLVNNDSISCSIITNTNCGFGLTAGSNNIAAAILAPVILGAISGPADVCPLIGSTASYSVAPVAGTNLYNWVVPAGTTIVSGQGSINITVSFSSSFAGSGVISVTGGNCNNATPSLLNLILNVPGMPAAISGPASACALAGTTTTATYSIAAVPYATSYLWTVPANATLVSGQGTTSISVLFSGTFSTAPIAVRAVSNCFSSQDNAILVSATTTAIPGSISGPTEACAYIGTTATATYTIRKVTGAASYIWEVPAGVTVSAHTAGVNDTTIKVTFSSSFVSGTSISVKSAGCITSAASTLTVLKTAPATPGIISGPTEACLYIGTTNIATYTIRKVANATSYTWIVPAGITVSAHTAGINDTTIKVTYTSSFVTGTAITVQAVSCLSSAASSLTILKTVPATPGLISGPTETCPFIGTTTVATYSIRKVAGATTYNWVVPAGVTVSAHTAGVNDTTIKVTFTSSFVSGTAISVQAASCATSAASTLTLLKTAPATPGIISGPTTACAYIGTSTLVNYSIRKVAGATTYAWTVPAGVTVSSHPAGTGVNDTIIKVSFSSSFVNNTAITVKAVSCASSDASSLSILRPLPATPAAIKVIVSPCTYSILNGPVGGFSVAKIAGLTYTWSAPFGSSISHYGTTTGVEDSVYVTFPLFSSGGTISVIASNGCGNSSASSVVVGVVNPANVSLILAGPSDPCPYIGTTTAAVYTVKKVTGIAAYTWTIPATGATVTHPNGAGVNDTIILVNYTSAFTSGSISVTANTACGNSPAKSITLTKGAVATPGNITATLTAVCPSRKYTYSVAMPANATSVVWTVPSGSTILSGQGTVSIVVSYPATDISGTVTARGVNNCGTSAIRSLTVSLVKCATANRSVNTTPEEITKEILPAEPVLTVMPNPSYNSFRVQVKTNDILSVATLRITTINGALIETRNGIKAGQTIELGEKYKAGIYLGEWVQGNKRIIIKLVKL